MGRSLFLTLKDFSLLCQVSSKSWERIYFLFFQLDIYIPVRMDR